MDEDIGFSIDRHQAYEDFKAWMLYREDRDRKKRGDPPLEVELAEALATADPPIDKILQAA